MGAVERFTDEKDAFFAELEKMRPDLVYADSWTSEQKEEANQLLRRGGSKLGMLKLIPMDCQGADCLYARVYPLIHEGGPTHKPCPVESATVLQFFNDYVEELGVDINRMVEVTQVRDLVNQDIQALRASLVLGQEHFIQENVAGLDAEGNVVVKKELHQAVDYEERILKRKERLRNQLLATRESRARMGQSSTDQAQVIANVLEDVRRLERMRNSVVEQKLAMIEDAEIVDEGD